MKNFITLSLFGAALLTGCSSAPDAESIAQDEIDAQQLRYDAQQAHQAQESEKLEASIASMPKWVLSPPKADVEGVFGVGVADSKKPELAMRKSSLNAQFELAKQFKQEVNGQEQSYTKDSSTNTEQYTQLIDSIVGSVPVAGYRTVKQEMVVRDGRVYAYTLLKLPYDEFNAVINQKMTQVDAQEIKAAFADLQQRIKERKSQLVETSSVGE